jgi:predicted glycogen debranching enzyme
LWLSEGGLLVNGSRSIPLTWMDAQIGGHLVTPRRGIAVEMQAWWTKGTENLARLAHACHDRETLTVADDAFRLARTSFRERFWCNETHYPFDCVSEARGTAGAWADATVRPNALIALAVDDQLFERWQAEAIVDRARSELLTPRGLRSLAPREPEYRGHYEGPPEERGSSYHQGTAWTHLLGSYARAALRLCGDDPTARAALRARVEDALDNAPVLGHVAQLADGEDPHLPRGCPAQAWSVAELLRALTDDMGG